MTGRPSAAASSKVIPKSSSPENRNASSQRTGRKHGRRPHVGLPFFQADPLCPFTRYDELPTGAVQALTAKISEAQIIATSFRLSGKSFQQVEIRLGKGRESHRWMDDGYFFPPPPSDPLLYRMEIGDDVVTPLGRRKLHRRSLRKSDRMSSRVSGAVDSR